ncbi:MAG TPA: FAD/NAD(P)-binding oxidoreductase [Bryobacteraceae bacterium]|jgi:NADPH-dependent 2,4-dienoyl-CoA reductase/sulfur reductase-like enzyme|nr:FAD/NAD(P)-binding oxidoreductase [Bryobacteraceae bacterium]
MISADIVVVGAGPAGIAAAVAAAQNGANVLVVDDNFKPGGQIWRGETSQSGSRSAQSWLRRFEALNIPTISSAQVIAVDTAARTLLVEKWNGSLKVQFEKLVLATGARELFLPFPGWTLPGIMGVGGLQAMVKDGLPIDGKRVVIGGSGPLLLAVAAHLRHQGAIVTLVAEQALRWAIVKFTAGLINWPGKITQAFALRCSLGSVPYRFDCSITEAMGETAVEAVRVTQGGRTWTERCDYAAIAYGLSPNTELAALLGARLHQQKVAVDDCQESSIKNVFVAGECTGIGGVDLALIEGEIAGLAASGQRERSRKLWRKRSHARNFAQRLNHAFRLRDELRALPTPETLLCRCEDVSFGQVRAYPSLRAAKLHTRCGMGPCQARICGAAAAFLFGWNAETPRPPVLAGRVGTLAGVTSNSEKQTNLYEEHAMARSHSGHHDSV